jgi:hypothetical protein
VNVWEARRAEAIAEAERLFGFDPDTGRVVEVTVEWLRMLRPIGPAAVADLAQLFGPGLADGVLDRLRHAGLQRWADRFALLGDGRDVSVIPERISAELAIGTGVGRLCGLEPNAATFWLSDALQEAFGDAHRTFAAEADRALAEAPGSAHALAGLLRARVNDFTAAPRRMAHVHGVSTCGLAETHRRSPRLLDAWGEIPVGGLLELSTPEAYDMLRRRDPQLYLEIIEGFPHPEPARQALAAAQLEAHSAELCQLLRVAPLAFSEDGTWIVAAKTPFLLLGVAVESIRHVALPPQDGRGSQGETDAVVGQVLDALMSRPDAIHLGYAWAERLIHEGHRSGRRRNPDVSAGEVASLIASVLSRLAASLPVLADPVAWVGQAEELWRRERALAVLAVMVCGEVPRGGAGEFMARAARNGQLETTGVGEALAEDASVECWVASNAVVGLPDPAAWFRDAWRILAPVRDRARHLVLNRGTVGHGGHVLAVWGLCGLMHLPDGSPKAKALWAAIETAVRESRLTDWDEGAAGRIWARTHVYLAGLWPRTFPEDPTSGEVGSLDDFLRPFGRPNDTLAEIALTLWNNGADPTRIARAVSSTPSLKYMLAAVAEDRALRRRSPWVPRHGGDVPTFDQKLNELLNDLVLHKGD